MSVRKHLYLITEHEQEDRIGGVSIMDNRMSRPEKNQEGPVTVFDEDEGDFREVGAKVHLGYADFESEDVYEDRIGDVIREKLAEVDQRWLEKAGLDPDEVLN
jgi:hypothetical protein